MKRSELKEIIRKEVKILMERTVNALDSNYLQRTLNIIKLDLRKDAPNLAKLLSHLEDRINQSFPDGDVTQKDFNELMGEVNTRKLIQKADKEGFDRQEIIDMIFTI